MKPQTGKNHSQSVHLRGNQRGFSSCILDVSLPQVWITIAVISEYPVCVFCLGYSAHIPVNFYGIIQNKDDITPTLSKMSYTLSKQMNCHGCVNISTAPNYLLLEKSQTWAEAYFFDVIGANAIGS